MNEDRKGRASEAKVRIGITESYNIIGLILEAKSIDEADEILEEYGYTTPESKKEFLIAKGLHFDLQKFSNNLDGTSEEMYYRKMLEHIVNKGIVL